MKIPTVEYATPKQSPVSQVVEKFNFDSGTDTLVAGVGALTAGVQDIEAVNAARAQKAKEKADGAAVDSLFAQAQEETTKGLHGYDKPAGPGLLGEGSPEGEVEHVPGYLSTKGNEAHAASGQFTTDLQKKYDDLLASAKNDEQRAALTKRLLALKQTVRETVAGHESKQLQVAATAASEALQDSTVRMAGEMYNQPDKLKPFVLEGLESIQRNTLPEEYEEKANQFLGRVAVARIETFIARGDFEGASHQVQVDARALGAKQVENYESAIKAKKEAAETKAAQLKGEATAQVEADKLRNEHGFLDEGRENALRAAINKLPPNERIHARGVIEDNIRFEQQIRKAKIDEWTGEAETQVNNGAKVGRYGLRTIDPELVKKLEKYNQPFIAKVLHDERVANDRYERKRLNKSADIAARRAAAQAEKEQKRANELALTKMKSLPWEEQAEFEKKHGFAGMELDEIGVAKMQEQQRKAINLVKAGHGKAKEDLDNALDGYLKGKEFSPDKGDPAKKFRIKADASEELEKFIERENRVPSAPEREKLISDAYLRDKTRPREFFGFELSPGPERRYEKREREAKNAPVGTRRVDPKGVLREKNAQGLWVPVEDEAD